MAPVFFTARKTIKNYANGGNVLIVATALALIIVNIPFFTDFYNNLWTHEIELRVGSFNLFSHHGEPMSIMAFINDALMAVFFFSVGLEIKREVLVGELSSFRNALLPIVAAVGGMGVPVLIYWLMAGDTPYAGGAAIPMATDIAFSLGVLAMLGKRVPIGLKVFLTTLAVVDDIGGILVIAIFYSSSIDFMLLIWAACCIVALIAGALCGIQSKLFYGFIGTFVWFFFLNAGIHPTIAGVIVAFTIPAKPVFAPKNYVKTIRKNIGFFSREDDEALNTRTILNKDQMNWLKEIETASDKVISPLQDMEDTLHPLVNYIIVPLFAFANAGIFFGDMNFAQMFNGIAPAIIVSLVVGKFLGIFLFSWLTIRLKLAPMPEGANWSRLASVSVLGGIGFTVSLFIANLSFGSADPFMAELLNDAKLGILIGSLLAGILGWALLHFTLPKEPQPEDE
ncbi:MAG: Na+/H+ antiporter NhaA [Candidatus Amulumruptor caecigallinarius]|nr:Na+/H+ antiporter NhaA [Candidatus Amulumruptor caecigallinarius]